MTDAAGAQSSGRVRGGCCGWDQEVVLGPGFALQASLLCEFVDQVISVWLLVRTFHHVGRESSVD